ncbi:MAG: DegT/DnrJ/EryC1/StrS family aminotransferase [Chloroflexota bacterium]
MAIQGADSTHDEGPLQAIPLTRPDLPTFDDIKAPVQQFLESKTIAYPGPCVEQFEREAGANVGAHAVSVSSASMGLLFTLQAFGLKAGQRVILPGFTFTATAQAIRYAGGVPSFVEVEEDLTVSPSDLESLLSRYDDIAAVVPVHLHGQPCRVAEIQQVVDAAAGRCGRPIPVIYDAADAFGASVDGRMVGTFGNAEVFSLSTSQALSSIEGGLVTSHHVGLVQRIRKMRNYGLDDGKRTYWPGLNGRLSEVHAIFGLASLHNLSERLAQRQRKARAYAEQIERMTSFRVAARWESSAPTFRDFTIIVPQPLKYRRDQVVELLTAHGVEARTPCFPPVHQQPYFRNLADRPLPVTEDLSLRVVTIPFFTTMTGDEMEYVIAALAAAEAGVTRERVLSSPSEVAR